jgi:hypothetical protein
MKSYQYNLTITFSGPINSHEQQGMLRRITDALKHEVDAGMGLAPDREEDEESVHTVSIEATEPITNQIVKVTI